MIVVKSLFSLLLVLSLNPFTWAEQKAVTETGEEVILHDDGSWNYVVSPTMEREIFKNPQKFAKPKTSTFLLKSKKINVGFWLNPKEWKFTKGIRNSDAEYELELKDRGADLYAMIITEKFEVPLKSFKQIAIVNAQKVAPDIKVVKEEYRNVNGLNVLLLQLHGTTNGIKFAYYGYYYSNKHGSVQFITFTSQKLQGEYLPQAEELLNGLVALPNTAINN